MTTGLSYPSQCCILEYTEANWRLHVASRCPSLSKIDKSIPLRLNSLIFEPYQVILNNISYELCESEEEINKPDPKDLAAFGDIVLKGYTVSGSHIKKILQIKIASEKRELWKLINLTSTLYQDLEAITRKMIDSLLGGRSLVVVNSLSFWFNDEEKIVRLPLGLKFRVNILDSGYDDFPSFLHLLTASSFPLKRLKILELSVDALNHTVLREAHGLKIGSPGFETQDGLAQFLALPHKLLEMECYYVTISHVLNIIDFWVKNKKEVGTELRLDSWIVWKIARLVEEILSNFEGARYVKLKEATEILAFMDCLSIPISSHSKLIIYAIQEYCPSEGYNKMFCTVVLKVVPTGATEALASEPEGTTKKIEVQENKKKWWNFGFFDYLKFN